MRMRACVCVCAHVRECVLVYSIQLILSLDSKLR